MRTCDPLSAREVMSRGPGRRVRLEVDRQHLDRDVAGVLLTRAVDGLVGRVDGLRLGAGLEAQGVLRHEEVAVRRLDERRDQVGRDVDRVAVGVVVVLEHRDRHDVARAHDDLVVVRDGRAQLRRRGHGDDDDLAVGGLRAVRDAVRDPHLAVEGRLVADAQRLVAQHRHRDAGRPARRVTDCTTRMPSAGVGVVGQDVDEHLAAARQQRDVAHRDGRKARVGLGQHVDAHDARAPSSPRPTRGTARSRRPAPPT